MTAPPVKFSATHLDILQTRLISALKQSHTPSKSSSTATVGTSGSLNDAIAILTELREHMPQIVHNPNLYERFITQWTSLFKDMLVDTSLGDSKKRQKKDEDKQKDGKDVSKAGSAAAGVVVEDKANERPATKKAHPYYIRPNPHASSQHNTIRRCLLEILCRFPLNDQLATNAATILSICVNVLLSDYEGNALLATSLIFQLHKAYRLVGSPHSSNTTSVSRMKGEDARQLRECQVFLDFVCDCYRELNKNDGGSLQTNFDFSAHNDDMHTGISSTPMSTTESTNPKESMPSLPSRQSFRVLTECPLTVMLLFQLYPKFLKTNIPVMIPLMMDSLKLIPPRLVDPSKVEATPRKGDMRVKDSPVGIMPTTPATSLSKLTQRTPAKETPMQPTNSKTPTTATSTVSFPSNETIHRIYRTRAHELLAAQVKTLSFLTYLLRGFTDQMRPYEDVMANNVILLMKHCPSEAVSTRKELLVSTRHILATEFRKGFFRHIDVMMDERMIAGSSRYSIIEQLRPLGYSTLADLIHHARTLLTPAQLARAVRIFSRVLHDADMNMPLLIQVNAVKLIMHLVDQIFNNKDPNPQAGRDLLLRILSSFVQKVRTIKDKIPELLVNVEKEIQERGKASEGGAIPVVKTTGCKADEDAADGVISSPTSNLRDLQSLLRSLFQAMKTVIWCINSYAHQREKERQRALAAGEEQFPLPPSATNKENDEINSAMLKLTNGERELVSEYIVCGIPCLIAFRFSTHNPSGSLLSTPSPPQYREMVETFASSLTVLDGFNIRKTLIPNLPTIMDELDEDPELITLFKYLLLASGKHVSYECCDLLFSYLIDNLEVLSYINTSDDGTHQQNLDENDSNEKGLSNQSTLSEHAQNHYKLFIIVFSSVTKYTKNEAAILPHLLTFVPDCIRRSMEGHIWPGPYLSILRMLFQTLSGKFDASIKEMAPLLPTILNGFYRIYQATENEQLRLLTVELMLTISSHTVLLPHLPLLVKVLIPALQSNRGDLVNLGLRTLESWVDKLHLDYIYPILAQQRDTLCELMLSLTDHLRPAPYPYGLLCLRLLGKLGGKNRLFLHEVTSQDSKNDNKMAKPGLSMLFEWQKLQSKSGAEGDHVPDPFPLRLPLERAVDVLRYVANAPHFTAPKDKSDTTSIRLSLDDQSAYVKSLFKEQPECIDLNLYAVEVMEKIKEEQANSAFEVIRGVLASLLDLSADATDTIYLPKSDAPRTDESEAPRESSDFLQLHNLTMKLLCDGLFAATATEELKEEAMALLSGFGAHIIFIIESHMNCITRIDSDGAAVDNNEHTGFEQNHLSSGKLQPLKPFGCFRLSGTLGDRIDPFVFNQSLVDAMSESDSKHSQHAAREVMKSMLDLIQRLKATIASNEKSSSPTEDGGQKRYLGAGDVLAENLLSCMCQACFSQPWNHRSGAANGIVELLNKMGLQWSKAYEVEILHVAMFVVKDAPAEISLASKESLRFFITITWFFFGGPAEWDSSTLIYDILSPKSSHNPPQKKNDTVSSNIDQASLTLVMSEIASTKHLVRFAVRHFLRIVSRDNPSMIESAIKDNLNSLKRLIFPRILRNSPLPEQVAVVDSIAFMVEMAPQSFSIDDQTVLAFTAELLKMVAVADGDITDTFTSVVLIDKNGFAVNKESPNQTKYRNHTSSVFLKRSFTIKSKMFGGCVVVPDELPLGVQLRVASVYLFRSLIRRFPDQFFDAEPKSQVGNLRPHVVSLLFRSLTAEPPEVVDAAESALHDALLLGASEKEDNSEEPQKSSHRLPKELIQTCIRPILINLRDHTKLTIPLLRGISRLLTLLSSWFNKALGEKMIEHLSKFTEADKIISLQLWKPGDEPKVAAAVMGLFSLLPQASRFVEALVKTTLRLEAAWSTSDSLFRDPLARYLNRHCASAAGFFLEEHRLCNPLYSELFVDMLQQESSKAIRKYISGKECTVMLLNVCFERPLAIIRSEKNASSPKSSSAAYFVAYGINPMNSYSAQRKLEIARQDIAMKKTQIEVKSQEELSQRAAKLKPDDIACTLEHLKRELDSLRFAYSQELEQCSSQKDMPPERPMTATALELQHQGFRVVAVLMKHKEIHLQEQNDLVRALRWLWRSRGRHYRLLYQEEIHPRFSSESYMLANFLISYSEANPEDIDVLFDLIRIFLNPTSIDFNFVKEFLHRRVAHDLPLEHRDQVLQRYLTLLSSEGTEENKILSTNMLILPMLTHTLQAGDKETIKAVVSDASISQLMESLFNGSACSTKLTSQLLRLVTVLLEHMHEDLAEHRKDLIKYIWGILKSDDAGTKYYGYLAVSRFVEAFETPPKVTLQVYRSLLRSHNIPEKQMVHAALNILVPSLPNRLSPDELEVALKYTVKIIHEEANSVQQLAHLFDCITKHPQVYSAQSSSLIPHMAHSLSALGTSQNSPPEYKHLSIAVGRLIFDWKKTQPLVGPVSHADAAPNTNETDLNIMDTIINFGAKMVLSNAEGKVDTTRHQIHDEATSLLKDVLAYHPNANISSIHFEKVFSFGLGGAEMVAEQTKKATEKNGDVKKGEKSKKSLTKDAAPDKRDGVESMILLAGLEFFSILLSINPSNAFLRLNQARMLVSCFSNEVSVRENGVQIMIENFVANLVATGELGPDISILIALLEGAVAQASCQSVEEESDEKNHRAYMAINIIEKVNTTHPDFVEPFISSLASFAHKQVKQHIQETPRATSSMIAGGMNNIPLATPTLSIFELACGIGAHAPKGKDFMSGFEVTNTQAFVEVESIKPSLRALAKSLRLIGFSAVLSTFSSTRKLFLEVLSLLLDSSTCIPLLMTTLGILRKEVMANDQRVQLTRSEQEEYLSRIAHIDFIKLPVAASQVLCDMICCIALSNFGYDPLTDMENPAEREENTTTKVSESGMNKLFAFCLMSGNRAFRSIALGLFSTEIRDYNIVHKELMSQAAENLQVGDSIDILGIPGKSPHKVIRQFLNSDMEYLGKSMWTLVLVELLLAVGKHDGRLSTSSQWHCDQHNVSDDACLRLKHNFDNKEECKVQINTSIVSEGIYSAFVKRMSSERNLQFGRGRCISAIRRIAYADVDTSQSILQSCFQAAWQQFPSDDERSAVIQSIENVLAMTHHTQFLQTKQCHPMNAVQSLLRLVIHLRPMPAVDTFLLSALAADYNVHYEVLAYLEHRYLVLQRSGSEASSEATQLLKKIHECFLYLGDRDVTLAISSALSNIPGTKLALSLDTYGAVTKSTDAYLSLFDRAGSGKTEFMPSEFELKLWEQQWIEAHKELSQWEVINDVSSNLNDKSLMIECAWKSKNWAKVKSLCGSPSVISAIEQGDCNAKMTEIFLAIHSGKLAEVENLHAQAAQLCLHKLQLLPSVGPGSSAHTVLFQQFQRLVELRESSQIMIETFSHCTRRTIPDLNNVLGSWRNRNPNFFDSISVWEDLYSWRFQIFDTIAKKFAWTDSSTLSTLHDRPSAAVTLGRAARKHGLKEVSMFLMSDPTDVNMNNVFLKLREQIVTHQHSQDEAMLKGGLNLVNSTNLTFFDAREKAEFFRLKSYFFNALNDKSNAHKNYCHAVQLCPNYARAWIDWGHLCLSLADNSKKASESKRKMNIQYMAQATACFLEAVRLDASEQSRENIPHCLSMLSLDSHQFGYLFKAFEARAPLLPAWTWLPWIPQLLTSLCRAEAHCTKSVLMKMANDHPQALYYSLRAFFLERRDIERSKDHDTSSKNEDDAQKHAEILMSTLRKTHPVLWSRLEAILEDLIIRFRPSYEAELLVTIKALLDKAKSKLEQTSNDATPDGLLESIRASLIKISVKFFNKEKPDSQKGRKTLLFEKKWYASFNHDFVEKHTGPDGDHQGPGSIDELIVKLEAWKAKLECHVSNVPSKCHLQETSPSLSWHSGQSSDYWAGSCESASLTLSNSQHDHHSTLDNVLYEATQSSAMVAHKVSSDAVHLAFKTEGLGGHEGGGSAIIEIPGQYAPTSSNVLDFRPFPELHAKLVHFHQSLEVISSPAKQDQTVRQITMIGSDGKKYKFLLQLAIPYWTRSDERSAQLQYITGKILKRNIQAYRRCLSVQPNVVIPVAQRMRMTANEPSYCTLDFVAYHAEGPSLCNLATFFETEVAKRLADTEKSEKDVKTPQEVKLEVYRYICERLVPPTILSKYMMDTIPSIEKLIQFRKLFASQLSTNSVLQHAFAVIERTPLRFMFCNSTGRILAQDFRFQYNQGLLEAQTVPFRMTRCIAEFIGPFLLQGIFIPSFASISSALNAKRNALEPVLHLLLRDDIISWYTSKTQPRHDKKLQEMEHQLSDRVWKNIHYVQVCIEESATREVENAAEEAISTNPQPIDAHVRNLLAAATNEQKLSLMSSSYQAWL